MPYELGEKERKKILKEWNLEGLSREEQIVGIYEKVRDIPFGRMGSRDPFDVYVNNKGTCSGKNFLLKELYRGIGLETKDMICLQRWKDLTWFPDDEYDTVDFPDDLKALLESKEVIDFHNYVKVYVHSRWVQVDATIDLPLRELGFHTVENWDGVSDMPLCFVGTHKVWDCGDRGAERKAQLTAELPEDIQKAREQFLKMVTAWIDAWRKSRG